jgi:hypothetical protein
MEVRRIAAVVIIGLWFAGCGSNDSPSVTPSPTPAPAPTPSPTPAPQPPPDVSGRYSGTMTLQVLRESDNFQTSFNCSASMTITQSPGASAIGGFWVSNAPCEPVSYDITGSVQAGGATTLRTNGTRPPQGTCPGGKDVDFSGIITTTGTRALSLRGATKVQCGDLGTHDFTYILAMNRLN